MMPLRSLIALASAVIGMVGSAAKADTISFQLGLANPAVAPYTGPYVDVLINRTSTTSAQITFTSLSNGTDTFLLGDGGSAGVNVNASSWTIGSILGTSVGSGFTPGPYSDAGSGNQDGFGSYNQKVDSFDGYSHTADVISFVLTNLSGTWASATNVLTPNGSGYVAAAHVFVASCATASACSAGNGALDTGFAAATVVPEPGTALLLGLGLVGLAVRRR